MQPMSLSVSSNTIICPREVEAILAVRDGRSLFQVQNIWYQYVSWDMMTLAMAQQCSRQNQIAYMDGTTPVTNQITYSSPMYIRATSSIPASDASKAITVFGVDGSGNAVQSTIALAAPFGSSVPVQFARVDRVVKDITAGYVTLHQDDNAGNLLPLSVYQPSETTPDYIIMRFGSQTTYNSVTALVKLAFIPAYNDTDKVLIENQDALRDMVLSIRKKEAGDLQSAAALETMAHRELNREMRNRFPDEQTIVSVKPFGTKEFNTMTNII